jgi:DNA-binding transcriptional regulator YiaG
MGTALSLKTAFTALERAHADAVRVITALPEVAQRMDAADRLAAIAQRHLGTASRIQHEEALGSHSAHPLDFSTLARSQLREARERRGASPDEFAEILTKFVGHHVSSGVVEAWEGSAGGIPPADVVLAVQQLLG